MGLDSRLVGSAGEHHVCSVLAQLGWAASLTREGLERSDILAAQTEPPRRMIEVQVKTAAPSKHPSWPLGRKGVLGAEADREWFVFVCLAEPGEPARSFVVPRDHVAAGTWIRHQSWLHEPGIPEGQRNAPIDRARAQLDVWERYENRWDLLAESAFDAPVLLPPAMHSCISDPKVGLPHDHRWLREGVPPWPGT